MFLTFFRHLLRYPTVTPWTRGSKLPPGLVSQDSLGPPAPVQYPGYKKGTKRCKLCKFCCWNLWVNINTLLPNPFLKAWPDNVEFQLFKEVQGSLVDTRRSLTPSLGWPLSLLTSSGFAEAPSFLTSKCLPIFHAYSPQRWVLTAAHCANGASSMRIMLGAHNVREDTEEGRVEVTWVRFPWNSLPRLSPQTSSPTLAGANSTCTTTLPSSTCLMHWTSQVCASSNTNLWQFPREHPASLPPRSLRSRHSLGWRGGCRQRVRLFIIYIYSRSLGARWALTSTSRPEGLKKKKTPVMADFKYLNY